jgi:hypothetical protein
MQPTGPARDLQPRCALRPPGMGTGARAGGWRLAVGTSLRVANEKDGGPLRISIPLPEGQKSKRSSRQEGLALVGRL